MKDTCRSRGQGAREEPAHTCQLYLISRSRDRSPRFSNSRFNVSALLCLGLTVPGGRLSTSRVRNSEILASYSRETGAIPRESQDRQATTSLVPSDEGWKTEGEVPFPSFLRKLAKKLLLLLLFLFFSPLSLFYFSSFSFVTARNEVAAGKRWFVFQRG